MTPAWRYARTVALRRNARTLQATPHQAQLSQQRRALSVTRSLGVRAAAAAESTSPAAATTTDELLEQSLAQSNFEQALARFDQLQSLQSPPTTTIAQRLAILLAKRGRTAAQITRAFDVLKSVYLRPALQADDYTKLASIYVVDACLRFNLLDAAVEIYEEALNASVVLDLPAYDALVCALVAADRIDDAATILREVVAQRDVAPTESTFAPLLVAMMTRFDYVELIELIDHGRQHGIAFTLDTYDPLVDLGEVQGDDPDCIDGLERFMVYVNQALEDDGLLTEFDDEDDDEEENSVEIIEFEDDDDDENDRHDDDEFH